MRGSGNTSVAARRRSNDKCGSWLLLPQLLLRDSPRLLVGFDDFILGGAVGVLLNELSGFNGEPLVGELGDTDEVVHSRVVGSDIGGHEPVVVPVDVSLAREERVLRASVGADSDIIQLFNDTALFVLGVPVEVELVDDDVS